MIRERIYQKVTRKQLEKCIKWCQNRLGLRDWQIEFYIGRRDKKEPSAGWTILSLADAFHETAELWIDLDYCKERNQSPYVAVCHEMIHILVNGKCRLHLEEKDGDEDEFINYTFQDMLYREFCEAIGIKEVPYQEN
jgi:hypothetical protein